MLVDPVSLAFAAKAAPIVLPLVSVFFKGVIGTDSPILSAFADLGLNIAAGTTGPAIEQFLSTKPDLVHHLTNQHFIRYTGDVLAALIKRFAEQPQMEIHREELLDLAKRTPEGWVAFIRLGAPGLKPLRHDEFLRNLAQSMDPQASAVDLSSVPFMTFFKWHVRFGDEVSSKLDAYLKSYLPSALHSALVSDVPSAQQAYREVIHRELLSLKPILRHTQQQLQQQGEKIDDLRDSPGFDLASYARKLREHCELIPLSDKGGTDTRERISLSSVFVAPSVRAMDQVDPDHLDLDTESADAAQRGKLEHLPDSKRLHAEQLRDLHRDKPARPAMDIINDPNQRGIIVLGDAGVGKTSLVRHLAIEWAQAYLDQSPDHPIPPLPLLIELRRFATEADKEAGFQLLDYLHQCEISIERLDRAWCRYYLEIGAAILILDGLDEVPDHLLREAIANEATRLITKGAKIFVTSRRVGFIQEHWMRVALSPIDSNPLAGVRLDWQSHLLQEFDDSQRDLFTLKTHALLYVNDVQRQEKTHTFKNRIARYPAIGRLTRNPLLLTLAALLHRTGGLGDNRVDLYTAASEMLLDTWELVRTEDDVAAVGYNLPPLLKDIKVRIVRRLARKIIESPNSKHHGENLFPISLLQEAVREVIDPSGSNPVQADAYADLMPSLLRERHSLLCWAGEDQYSFIHRSFLEFFAAQAWAMDKDLARLSPAEIEVRFLLGPSETVPHWRQERFQNIIPLYYGQLSDDRAAERLPLLWNLIDTEAPNETVLFAATCFVEIKAREEHHEFAQHLQQCLLTLANTKWDASSELKDNKMFLISRRAVRALVHLWGDSREIQSWLIQTLNNSDNMLALRREIVGQLAKLHGPTDSMREVFINALATTTDDTILHGLVCRAIGNFWGQDVLFDSLRSQSGLGSLKGLTLFDIEGLTQMPPLADFHSLENLWVMRCPGLQGPNSLLSLGEADKLINLYFQGCTNLKQVPRAADIPVLKLLTMDGCTGLQGSQVLRPLAGAKSLIGLGLENCTGLTEAPSGIDLPGLLLLDLKNCKGLQGEEVLNSLAGMTRLQELCLEGCTGLTRAPSGADLPSLLILNMKNCTGLQGEEALRPLAGMTELKQVHLEGCSGLVGLDVPALLRKLGIKCQVTGP